MMTYTRKFGMRAAAAILCVAATAWACGGDGGGPTASAPKPGQLTVNLATAGSGAAAFLVRVTGDSITNPTAAKSGDKLYSSIQGNTLRAAVIGSAANRALLRFHVPDVNAADAYGVTLEQVAGSDNQLQSTGDYTLTITK